MADDPTATIVADSFALWRAPGGTAMPTDVTTAMGTVDAAWKLLGLLDPENIATSSDPQITELFSAGYKDPTNTIKTREPIQFTANLQEWRTATLQAALNGGTVAVASSTATYTPVASTILVDQALVFEFVTSTAIYRIPMPRVQVRSGLSLSFPTGQYTVLPLSVTLLKPASGSTYKIISNDVTHLTAG
jgi:hypothetical protein